MQLTSTQDPAPPTMADSQRCAADVEMDAWSLSTSTIQRTTQRKGLFSLPRGWTVVLGGFILNLTFGSLSCGNIAVYLSSYIRAKMDLHYNYEEATWIGSETVMAQGVMMVLGGYLLTRTTPRKTALLGCTFATIGVMSTGVSIMLSPSLAVISYGIIHGAGTGIAYVVPLACSLMWFPENAGLVTGINLAGYTLGSAIFSAVEMSLINPTSLPVNPKSGFFEDKHMLDKVPIAFFLLGGLYAATQSLGCCLLISPPPSHNMLKDGGKCVPGTDYCPWRIPASLWTPSTQNCRRCSSEVAASFTRRAIRLAPFRGPNTRMATNNAGLFIIPDYRPRDGLDPSTSAKQVQCSALPAPAAPVVVFASQTEDSGVFEEEKSDVQASPTYSWQQMPTLASQIQQKDAPGSSIPHIPSAVSFCAMETSDDELDLSPQEAIQTSELFMLWVTSMLIMQVVVCSHSLDIFVDLAKATNQGLRSIIAPTSCALNLLSSIVWGALSDRYSYKTTMMASSGMLTVFFASYVFVDHFRSATLLHATWRLIVFSSSRSAICLLPSVVYKTFGPKHFGVNFGLVQTSWTVGQALQSLILGIIHQQFGAVGVMVATAVCTAGAFTITYFYDADASPGRIRDRVSSADPAICRTV